MIDLKIAVLTVDGTNLSFLCPITHSQKEKHNHAEDKAFLNWKQ